MYRVLLRLLVALTFPTDFRSEFGKEVVEAAEARAAQRRAEGSPTMLHQVRTLLDVGKAGLAERLSDTNGRRRGPRPGGGFVDTLVQDVRYGLRGLIRVPGFALIAVGTLALGIGGNTAIFSVVNSVVLRPPDFPEPDRVVRLQVGAPVTPRQIDGIAERAQSYEALAGAARTAFTLTGDGRPEEIQGSVVGTRHQEVFGVAPALGRGFVDEDALLGATPVAVLSHEVWLRRFGGDPDMLGRTVPLGGEGKAARTIVGVWPAGYAPFGWPSDVFVPIERDTDSHLYIDMARFQLAGRLRASATYRSALDEFRSVLGELSTGAQGAYFSTDVSGRALLVSYQEAETGGVRGTLWLLLGAVGVVLLIACTNVANLVLARSASRSHELAIRTAIGAGRRRVFRQLLTESVVLAALGGVVGGFGAFVALPLLVTALPSNLPRLQDVSVDLTVLAFAALVSLTAGIAFGLLPAFRSARSAGSALRSGARGAGVGPGRFRLNGVLVAAQIGLCLVLVAASGLLLKSLWLVGQVDPGFNAEQLHTLRVRPLPGSYPELEQKRVYYDQVLARLAAVPGVSAAGGIQVMPMSRGNTGVGISPDGAPVPDNERPTFVGYRMITPGYGEAMGIPLIEGRWIDRRDDANAPPVGLINERMAARMFPDQSAVGQTVHWNTGDVWFTVIGVIGNVHHNGLDEDSRMEAYVPVAQDGDTEDLFFVVRSSVGASILPAMRQAVWSVDANAPINREASMEDLVAASLADRRGQALLFTLFGILALALSSIGVYGVTVYTVSQRTHEMGVRLALGAGRATVVRSTLRSALTPVVAGLVIGAAAALVATRLLASALYQTAPHDPAVLLGVTLFLGAVALVAALGPARKAARTDPMVVLTRG